MLIIKLNFSRKSHFIKKAKLLIAKIKWERMLLRNIAANLFFWLKYHFVEPMYHMKVFAVQIV